ncbi:MAG: DoxX family protein [Chitinophagaceae bacterium]|nr:DoxX family protein [Chitinophagaceae bacterium]MCW5905777.1 DoxX family protein [Chitinophagaceae bacterium]
MLTIIRWIVGLLFIFSGLIKANDPLGLSYKMQEFFEAWHLKGFHDYTLAAAYVMNVLEVVAGIAVIVGWQMKRFAWLLLLLIIFFTFLTAYVLFSGKIHACGCFGDCVPLTPTQTFVKDIALLLLILVLFFNAKKVKPLFSKKISILVITISFLLTTALQSYALKYLPILDCLPYAKTKNIQEGMKLSEGAVPDSFAITFKYKKNNQVIEFDQNNFPDDFDDSYEYIDRFDKLIRKGTALPAITDFSLTTLFGTDTTEALLNSHETYIILFAKDFSTINKWKNGNLGLLVDGAKRKNIPFYIATADVSTAQKYFTGITILSCDATVIKTAARVNPTYFLMNGAKVVDKLSYASEGKLLNWVK